MTRKRSIHRELLALGHAGCCLWLARAASHICTRSQLRLSGRNLMAICEQRAIMAGGCVSGVCVQVHGTGSKSYNAHGIQDAKCCSEHLWGLTKDKPRLSLLHGALRNAVATLSVTVKHIDNWTAIEGHWASHLCCGFLVDWCIPVPLWGATCMMLLCRWLGSVRIWTGQGCCGVLWRWCGYLSRAPCDQIICVLHTSLQRSAVSGVCSFMIFWYRYSTTGCEAWRSLQALGSL